MSFFLGCFAAHSSLDDHLARWFGLNQSKYQWALDDYYESKGLVSLTVCIMVHFCSSMLWFSKTFLVRKPQASSSSSLFSFGGVGAALDAIVLIEYCW